MRNKTLKMLAIVLPVLIIVMNILLFVVRVQKALDEAENTADFVTIQDEEINNETNVEISEEIAEEEPSSETEPESSTANDSLSDIGADPSLKDVTLVFAGDVLLGDRTLPQYQASGLSGILSNDLTEIMTSADICMVNEEFPYSTRGTQAEDKQFTFRTDPKYVTALTDMGVDIVTLANNHILDFGVDALLDSCSTLDDAGILYCGAGENLSRSKQLQIIEKGGKKFGFLAASRVWPVPEWAATDSRAGCFGTYDPAALIEEIKSAKTQCDFLTVYVHWGIERQNYPEDYQKNMAKMYIESGCDLVIGSHPHCLQGIEYFDGKPVFYSLGNYVFGKDTNQTAAIRVTVPAGYSSAAGEVKYEIIPAAAHNAFTYMTEGDEAQNLYSYMTSISYGANVGSDGIVANTK